MKSPISAVVVSRNEGALLSDCLDSISFCDEIIVYDLESTDETFDIATRKATKVIRHKVVPIVEEIRMEAAQLCKHDWMIFADPDERTAPELATQLAAFVTSSKKDIAIVNAPIPFYFKRRKLKGTVWGPEKFRPILFYRPGLVFTGDVHQGIKINPGYGEITVGDFDKAYITHFWSDAFSTLISKHRRYLDKEGSSRYNNGERYPGFPRHLRFTLNAFYSSYIYNHGYRDGVDGLLLSLFWSWYTFGCLRSLRRYERSVR